MNVKGMILASVALFAFAAGADAQFRNGASYDDLYDGETVATLKNHVRELSAAHLEGRKAGSEGEAAAALYVEDRF